MSTAPKIIIHPRVVTHAVTPPNGIIETIVDGGLPLTRADILHGPSIVPVSWVLETKAKFEYLMAMYNSTLKEGALPCQLFIPVLSSTSKWLECKFVPKSFRHTATDGVLRMVVAQVRVINKRDAESDEYLVALTNATGSFDEADHLTFLNLFDNLVNVALPENLGDN